MKQEDWRRKFIKLLGAVMVISASVLWGALQARGLHSRAAVLRRLQWSLSVMEKEISSTLTPMNEIMSRLEDQPAPVGTFFNHTLIELQDNKGFEEAWREALTDSGLELRSSETQTMLELGGILGRYGASEQIEALHAAEERMAEFAVAAETECSEKSKLIIAGGACAGLSAVILLI